MDKTRTSRWSQIVARVAAEYRTLPDSEKDWIGVRLDRIEELQRQLQQLFDGADGVQSCRDCAGECCSKGHNHMTLVNLLGFIRDDRVPPTPDFSQTCPFLGASGCLLAVAQRPYNCISFVCDRIETELSAAELERFYTLEAQLRALYLEFAQRYLGAAMTGLLLQEQRLDGRSFFSVTRTSA